MRTQDLFLQYIHVQPIALQFPLSSFSKFYTVDIPALEIHVFTKVRDWLLIKLMPLSKVDIVGKESRQFWFTNIKQAQKSLNPALPLMLIERAIYNIGPIILKPLIWDQIATRPFMDWAAFKQMILAEFWYTKVQEKAKFLFKWPQFNQCCPDFILEVEAEHKIT